MLPLLLCSVLWSAPLPGPAQEAARPAPELNAPSEGVTEEARKVWERVCAASGSAGRDPLTAFLLEADVRTRSGVQRNEAHIDYRYLAPDCIRFVLPSKNETGRFGPSPEQYWVKTGDQVTVLAGREFQSDRRQVDDMLALAKNYVALSNPARLKIEKLELLSAAPGDLGAELAARLKKLSWLAIESPDFALVRGEIGREAPAVYRVEIGLRGADELPAVAIVRERGKPQADPLLVEFSQYQEQDGFKLPFQLRVHAFDRAVAPPVFAKDPVQEVYVTAAALRPPLTVDDFKPKKPK